MLYTNIFIWIIFIWMIYMYVQLISQPMYVSLSNDALYEGFLQKTMAGLELGWTSMVIYIYSWNCRTINTTMDTHMHTHKYTYAYMHTHTQNYEDTYCDLVIPTCCHLGMEFCFFEDPSCLLTRCLIPCPYLSKNLYYFIVNRKTHKCSRTGLTSIVEQFWIAICIHGD